MVQGVGFRATARSIAAHYAVAGWVRNLADGRVELLVEGAEPEVRRFLKEVREQMRGYIEDEQTEERPATGQEVGFRVVR
jgi:acylphosphatase